jgi:hypothetical protein
VSETARLERKAESKQVGIITAALVALSTAVAGGGAGSLATGQSVAAELREFRAVVLGRFDQLEARAQETNRNAARVESVQADHEKRLRALELDAVRDRTR